MRSKLIEKAEFIIKDYFFSAGTDDGGMIVVHRTSNRMFTPMKNLRQQQTHS